MKIKNTQQQPECVSPPGQSAHATSEFGVIPDLLWQVRNCFQLARPTHSPPWRFAHSASSISLFSFSSTSILSQRPSWIPQLLFSYIASLSFGEFHKDSPTQKNKSHLTCLLPISHYKCYPYWKNSSHLFVCDCALQSFQHFVMIIWKGCKWICVFSREVHQSIHLLEAFVYVCVPDQSW